MVAQQTHLPLLVCSGELGFVVPSWALRLSLGSCVPCIGHSKALSVVLRSCDVLSDRLALLSHIAPPWTELCSRVTGHCVAWASCSPSSLSVVKLLKQGPYWVHPRDHVCCLGRMPHSLLVSMKSPVVLCRVADRFFFLFHSSPILRDLGESLSSVEQAASHGQLSPELLAPRDRQGVLPCWILSVGAAWSW